VPAISVIIPCYNVQTYVGKCLEQLRKQTFTDFEIILVDDCSTDSTYALLTEYRLNFAQPIKILSNKKNSGPSISRKNGIAVSKAEYITFCDSDDWYDENFLKLMYEASNQEKNDIVFCNYKSVFKNGRIVQHDIIGNLSSESSKSEILVNSPDSLSAMMIRRCLLEDIEFPDIRNGEDMAIIPVIISKGENFGFVKQSIYNYFQRSDSLSVKQTNILVENLQKSYAYIEQKLDLKWHSECEFLGIRNLLYGAILNELKQGFHRSKVNMILCSFEEDYSNWRTNRYLIQLPLHKRIFIFFVSHRIFSVAFCIARMHALYVKL